jgi:hypothetical protein
MINLLNKHQNNKFRAVMLYSCFTVDMTGLTTTCGQMLMSLISMPPKHSSTTLSGAHILSQSAEKMNIGFNH